MTTYITLPPILLALDLVYQALEDGSSFSLFWRPHGSDMYNLVNQMVDDYELQDRPPFQQLLYQVRP
jgi:hypothetical protein